MLEPDSSSREEAIEAAIAGLTHAPDAPAAPEPPVARPEIAPVEAAAAPPAGQEADGFEPVRVMVNGRPLEISSSIAVSHNEIMVPGRAVAESLGYTVTPLDPDHVEIVSARGDTWRIELPGYDWRLAIPAGKLARCLSVAVRFDAPNRVLHIDERPASAKAFRTRYPVPIISSCN